MLVSQGPWRATPFRFTGTSWLISNVVEFTRQESEEPSDGWLHGVSLEAFGGPRWWDKGIMSARRWLDEVPPEVVLACREGRARVVFDMSNEGQVFLADWIACLHDELDARGLPAAACTLLQQNRVYQEPYLAWAQAVRRTPMHIGVYDHFPRRLAGVWSQSPIPFAFNPALRTKHFCCLNFTPRAPRVGIVSWLLAGGFDKLGYVSFATGQKDATVSARLEPYAWFPEMETIRRGLEMLRARVPLLLDLPADPLHPPEYDLGPQSAYQDSYFSIVTESDVSDGSLKRITEKSLKPLMMLHPFVIIGNPGTLELLRATGFATFPEMFDESYDLVEDPCIRVRLIMQELAGVLASPIADLHDKYMAMRPKLLENSLRARSYLSAHYATVVEPALIDTLLDRGSMPHTSAGCHTA